jgi:hypothetical protein
MLKPRYSEEEFARRGESLYEEAVRPRVTPADHGKFAAIDIETGDYELDDDDYTATERLLMRYPDAQMWLARVGEPTAYRIL